jgi:hypothetical protein
MERSQDLSKDPTVDPSTLPGRSTLKHRSSLSPWCPTVKVPSLGSPAPLLPGRVCFGSCWQTCRILGQDSPSPTAGQQLRLREPALYLQLQEHLFCVVSLQWQQRCPSALLLEMYRRNTPGTNVSARLSHVYLGTLTYLFSPGHRSTSCDSSFHKREVNRHNIVNVDPSPGIRALIGIKWCTNLHDFSYILRKVYALVATRSMTTAVNIWRAHDGRFELIPMLGGCFLDEKVGVTVQGARGS